MKWYTLRRTSEPPNKICRGGVKKVLNESFSLGTVLFPSVYCFRALNMTFHPKLWHFGSNEMVDFYEEDSSVYFYLFVSEIVQYLFVFMGCINLDFGLLVRASKSCFLHQTQRVVPALIPNSFQDGRLLDRSTGFFFLESH